MEQTLGKRIAACRKASGLTQEGLAEKLGITAQAVSKWENDLSCPDISMLPRLAEIFGVTTDELLGLEKKHIHEAEVVPPEPEEAGGINLEVNLENSRKGALSAAVLILLVGGLLLAGSFLSLDLTFWGVLWPSALLVFGLFGIYSKPSFFRLGCLLVGGYYLLNAIHLIPEQYRFGKDIIFPLILVLLGLSLLCDALRKPRKPHFWISRNGKTVASVGKNHFTKGQDSFSCSMSFGEKNHRIQLPKLSRGDASVSFGELTVDLTDCKVFAEGCCLDVSCSFGELVLCVPESCRVEPMIQTTFAEFNVLGNPDANPSATVRVEGSVNFGEIVVKYV